jgi:hypothetical protein
VNVDRLEIGRQLARLASLRGGHRQGRGALLVAFSIRVYLQPIPDVDKFTPAVPVRPRLGARIRAGLQRPQARLQRRRYHGRVRREAACGASETREERRDAHEAVVAPGQMRGAARPAPVFRPFDEPRPHRVSHIARRRHQARPLVHRDRAEMGAAVQSGLARPLRDAEQLIFEEPVAALWTPLSRRFRGGRQPPNVSSRSLPAPDEGIRLSACPAAVQAQKSK